MPDDTKKAAKLAQLQALSASARTATPRAPLPPRPPLRQDVRTNSFGDILPPPAFFAPSPAPAAAPPSPAAPASPVQSLITTTPSPSAAVSPAAQAPHPSTPTPTPTKHHSRESSTTALDWESLKRQGTDFALENSCRPIGVRCSQDVFDRLTEARIQTGLDRGHVCAFLLQTYLPRPTKAHVRRGDELSAAALAREVRLAREYHAPEWLNQYTYNSRALRPNTIAVPVGRSLYMHTSEATLRLGLPLVALVEALVMRFLPQATSRYAKRRR